MLPSVQAREVVGNGSTCESKGQRDWQRSRNKYNENKAVNVLIFKIDSKLRCFFSTEMR